ncbi:MAG: AraC family transcriptional regulator [Opitutaceae bacterium]|jgi:AraC-like DNA-binding protein
MDTFPIYMDFRIKHWLGYTRRFPASFPLASANFIVGKNDWIHRTFDTCNFSLILKGRGQFHRLGVTHEVIAPCVITQWPGERLDYGPDLPNTTWDEFYLIYGASLMPRFETMGLVDRNRPMWSINDPVRVRALIDEFATLANSANPEHIIDRVDRIAEQIIVETLLGPDTTPVAGDIIDRLIANIRKNFAEDIDFDAVAARQGMSRATFRRRWTERISIPPARYLQELRMREACRLLAETNRPIHEVARAVGFADEFYFSRRFHCEHGIPPARYRKTYTINRTT